MGYQMFGELGDVALFGMHSGNLSVEYLEEVPTDYMHELFGQRPRLFWRFVYGRSFSALDLPSPGTVSAEFAELSSFLHPCLEFFARHNGPAAGPRQPALMRHSLMEDVFTEWNSQVGHIEPLLRFVEAVTHRAAELLRFEK